MDNVDKAPQAPRFGSLKITKAGGVNVEVVVALDAQTIRASLERIGLGENPLQVFAEFVATLAVVKMTVETDQRPLEMTRPSGIALPSGVDRRALGIAT